MDMAMSLSTRDKKDPFGTIALKLGDLQYKESDYWKKKGQLALCGSGVCGPENFPSGPFMERMKPYGFPYDMVEMESKYNESQEITGIAK